METLLGKNPLKDRRRRRFFTLLASRSQALIRQRVVRLSKFWEEEVPLWTEKKFKENFRMKRETFDRVVAYVADDLEPNPASNHHPVPLRKRVAIALWTISTTSEMRTVGALFGVGTSTVHKFFKMFVMSLLGRALQEQIRLPSDAEAMAAAERTRRRTGVPAIWAAIDGTHIPIRAPRGRRRDYENRKGWTSVVAQGVVDDRGRFVSFTCQNAGSNHDAHVLNGSRFMQLARERKLPQGWVRVGDTDVPLLVVGDAAYPLTSWLVKGFRGRVDQQQAAFNHRLNSARCVVEHSFGRLKARFRRILKVSEHYSKYVPRIVVAAAVLHNIVESSGDHMPAARVAAALRQERVREQPPAQNADPRWDSRRGRELQRVLAQYVAARA